MSIINDVKIAFQSHNIKNSGGNISKKAFSAATGDKVAMLEIFSFFINGPKQIRDYIFFEKYSMFLKAVFLDDDDIRKLSEVFADNEERNDYARSIIQTIDDIDSLDKTKHIINLTRAVLGGFIKKPDYFRLINVVRRTMLEDLLYLNRNIKRTNLKNNIHIQFLERNYLVTQTVISGGDFNSDEDDNEFEFTQLAHMLDQFGLDYGNEEKYKYSVTINSLDTEPITRSKIVNVGSKFF